MIRPIEEADWPQVHDLVVEVAAAGETYAMDVPASVEETRDFWSGQHVVVAVDGDTSAWAARRWVPTARRRAPTSAPPPSWSARRPAVAASAGRWGSTPWSGTAPTASPAIQFNAVVSTNTGAVKLWESLGFETIGIVPDAFRLPGGEEARRTPTCT